MKKYKLGEILDVKRGTSLSGKYYSEKGDKIRLTLGNFNYPRRGFKENLSKSDIYFTGSIKSEYILKKGDIITPLTEQVSGLLGETARIPEDNIYIQSGDIGLVIPDETLLDNKYAYYLVSSPIVKKQLDSGAQQTKIRHTSPDKIKDCIVWLPDTVFQKKVGLLLDLINLQIKNNNKINLELESMAKTIYDYWFLQFEFPNEDGKPYKSSGGKMVWNEELGREIPEEWGVKKLGDIFDFVKGKIPNKIDKNKNLNFERYLSIDVVNGGISEYCSKNSMVLTNGDVLMVMDGAASSEVYVGNRGVVGSTFCKLAIKEKNIHNNFLYIIMKKFELLFKKVNTGSTVPHSNKNYINSFNIALPYDLDTLQRLQKNICLFIDNISINKKENKKLESLREFLLPLLMNGQVKFKEEIDAKNIEVDKEEVLT